VLVDLVGNGQDVVLPAELRDVLQLLAGEYFARWIVGVADDDRPGAWIEGFFQLFWIEAPVGCVQLDVPGEGPREYRVRSVVFVERLEDDHLVTRVHRRHQRGDHPLSGAAGDGDLPLRIHLQPQIPRGFSRDGLSEVT
jgi:hypothetical protein